MFDLHNSRFEQIFPNGSPHPPPPSRRPRPSPDAPGRRAPAASCPSPTATVQSLESTAGTPRSGTGPSRKCLQLRRAHTCAPTGVTGGAGTAAPTQPASGRSRSLTQELQGCWPESARPPTHTPRESTGSVPGPAGGRREGGLEGGVSPQAILSPVGRLRYSDYLLGHPLITVESYANDRGCYCYY